MTSTTGDDEGRAEAPAVNRRAAGAGRLLLRAAALMAALLLALSLLGFLARDRTSWLAVLMYLPLVLIAPECSL